MKIIEMRTCRSAELLKPSVREVKGSIPGPVEFDTVLPTTRQRPLPTTLEL